MCLSHLCNLNGSHAKRPLYSGQENTISTFSRAAKPKRKVAPVERESRFRPKAMRRAYNRRARKTRKSLVRHSFVVANIALILVVTAVVWTGHNRAATPTRASIVNPITSGDAADAAAPLDEISSADIAVNVARMANLTEVDSVTNQADSYTAVLTGVNNEETVITKPQLVGGGSKSRFDIVTYTVKQGESVSSIAQKYGITSDSIRWSNGLSGDTVAAGVKLVIPPTNGIVHRVTANDSIDSLVSRYRSNKELFIAMNDTYTGLPPVGEYVLVPGGVQPVTRSYSGGNYSAYNSFAFGSSAMYGGNGYTSGYCTWHVANRRIQVGKPIPRNLGNAVTWASLARISGFTVSTQPKQYAVLWHANTYIAGGLGHVGFVESINADGSLLVSDMNYPYYGRVTYRTVPPSEFSQYRFIW